MLIRSREQKRAEVVDETTVDGNFVRLKTPKAISMVGSPANQIGFKIVRSDSEGEPQMPTPNRAPIIRRTRRSEASPVLRLTFPEGTSEEDVKAALTEYGLSGYTVSAQEGVFTAIRSDLKSISPDTTREIKLTDAGLIATVARADVGPEEPTEKSKLVMASVVFDATKFDLETVKRWAAEKCVDGTIEEPQNSESGYVVRRSEVPESEETRLMVLEDGVTAVIVRSDVSNVPDGFVAIVNEAAYGSWGWGQLDFTAMMADKEFSRAMDDSVWYLRDLMMNIILYSGLPLDVRKNLVIRAASQFGEYVGTVMDSLPRQLLVSVVRSANPLSKEQSMTKQTSGAATNEAKPDDTKNSAAPEGDKPLTRSDVSEMIRSAVEAALAAKTTTGSTEPAKEEKTAEPAAAPLTRSDIESVVGKALTDALAPVKAQVEQLAGTTVLRSEGEAKAGEKVEAGDKKSTDIFRGSLPGIRTRRAA